MYPYRVTHFNTHSDIKEFWITTGLFPQTIVIGFKEPTIIKEISIISYGAKEIIFEGSESKDQSSFEKISETSIKSIKLHESNLKVRNK